MRLSSRESRGEQAFALALVMVMTGVAFIIVASVLAGSSMSGQLTWRSMAFSRASAASDAALETAVALMKEDLANPALGAGVVSTRVDNGTYVPTVQSLVSAEIDGLTSVSVAMSSLSSTNPAESRFRIEAQTGVDQPTLSQSRASMELRILYRYVSEFSYCHDVDLEMYPWHNWVVSGPVYCGRTAYFRPTSGATLTLADGVYSVEGIVHGPHPNEPDTRAADAVVYTSEPRTRGPSLAMPAPAGAANGMRWILEEAATSDYGTPTGNERLVNKADVVVRLDNSSITVRKGPRHANAFVANTLPTNPTNVMYLTNMFDAREARTAELVVLDASKVSEWMTQLFGSALTHPVVYVNDQRSWPIVDLKFAAVRVENGVTLDGAGLYGMTLATPNPLYVKGHFNLINPKPALLAGDAITVLSDTWSDTGPPLSAASDTTLNAALVTGIVMAHPTAAPQGSGSVANVLRLLEDWDGRTLTFRGSMAVLYSSVRAVGPWSYGSPQYYITPTERVFGFTNYFAGLSLQTKVPRLRIVERRNSLRLEPQ